MSQPLRTLFVEDLPVDQELAERQLRAGGLEIVSQRVETQKEFLQALNEFNPDIILSDYSMPEFDGMQALKLAKEFRPDVPFILLTGSLNETTAVECMKAGASDYVIKEHMDRLPFAITEAITKQQTRNERRLSINQLLKNEASLKKAQRVAHLGSWTWNIQEDRLEWSDEMFTIFGISRESYTGKFEDHIHQTTHPDDLAAHERFHHSILNNENITSVEFHIIWPDGTIRVIYEEVGELLVDEKGQPESLIGIVQDITDRRKEEQQIRLQATALDSAANAIVITDRVGTIEWVNPAYCELTGFSSEDAIGQNPRILKSGFQGQMYYVNLWETITAGRVWRGELVNKRKDGSLYSEEETITPLTGSNGQIEHFIGIKVDISIRKQQEAEILKNNKELIDLNKEIQDANLELTQAYDATIEGWSQAMDLRDKETEGHTQRVTELTLAIAQTLGFREDKLSQIKRGALLHDIGKLGIPDEILHKPGPLTDEEWVVMKMHPVFANNMLTPIKYLSSSLDIPYCHHEKWDGSGYPRGLKGNQIPKDARIFALVDVYDALTSGRPYRAAWSKEKALAYIQDQIGTQFDPEIGAVFVDWIAKSDNY